MASILLAVAVIMFLSLPIAIGFAIVSDGLRWPKSPLCVFCGLTLVVIGAALIANVAPLIF